ncbi:hypothetical protein NVS47_03625 [Dehalobacterium formicoaceticum]|uniref:Uncharacterized protein n=1 Tax=Dehalobacterium formicoaceticum TaxID=51515 RepID=A0ABT1Y175_9FIRM|nr:hypothetical protein [Dehalobacterium formicoaceticum]MCR6544611.1 hypothetical protein [Dehalobacterium formicoaceticum]
MNNDEKILSLIEKMYIEFSGRFEKIDERFEKIDEKFGKIDERFEKIDDKFDELNNKLDQKANKNDIVRLENELKPKIEALFDGYKQNSDKLDSIITRLNIIEEKVENHDIHIAVLNKRKPGSR